MSSEGLTDREIAEILDIRPKTVKVHKQHALRRLRARNTAHAVAILLREGEIL